MSLEDLVKSVKSAVKWPDTAIANYFNRCFLLNNKGDEEIYINAKRIGEASTSAFLIGAGLAFFGAASSYIPEISVPVTIVSTLALYPLYKTAYKEDTALNIAGIWLHEGESSRHKLMRERYETIKKIRLPTLLAGILSMCYFKVGLEDLVYIHSNLQNEILLGDINTEFLYVSKYTMPPFLIGISFLLRSLSMYIKDKIYSAKPK